MLPGPAKLDTTIPAPVSTAPAMAATRGPRRSCRRPAGTIISANTPMASMYGRLASVLVRPQPPNSTVSVICLANTLQA